MSLPIRQFHLAIPAFDLEKTRRFYVNVLGAKQGRRTGNLVDLNFYGHHLVIHQVPEGASQAEPFHSNFYGEDVPIPHLGMNLSHEEWAELAQRIKAHLYGFYDAPHIRLKGEPGEHATMFLFDPSGNALEFKAFRNHDEVFAVVFRDDRDAKPLQGLVDDAAEPAA